MWVKVLKFQSILDIAVQETGSMENAFEIAAANGKAITDDINSGELFIPNELQLNANVVNRLADKRIKPATALTSEDITISPFGGIGYMKIAYDFIIS